MPKGDGEDYLEPEHAEELRDLRAGGLSAAAATDGSSGASASSTAAAAAGGCSAASASSAAQAAQAGLKVSFWFFNKDWAFNIKILQALCTKRSGSSCRPPRRRREAKANQAKRACVR